MKRCFLDTPHGQIHYAVEGSGDPLIMLHMTARSGDEYTEVIPLLAEKHQVIAMDTIGYGDSDRPTEPVSALARTLRTEPYIYCSENKFNAVGCFVNQP